MIATIQAGDIRTPSEAKTGVKALVIYSDEGIPLAVYLQMPGTAVVHYTAKDNNFGDILEGLGFDKASLPQFETKTIEEFTQRT